MFSFNNAVSMDVCCHFSCLVPVPGEDLFLIGITTPGGRRSATQSIQLHPGISSAFFSCDV